ncbi:MAG TPA: TonB-dependent receptor plug domain-containing protein [Opitutaceae bacterium]|nr:TonB-dependent receptor plug domain-containing protein [Opitutaceae bacterium]
MKRSLHRDINRRVLQKRGARFVAATAALLSASGALFGQAAASSTLSEDDNNTLITLSPFVVDASADRGYQASTTLAGTRIRTNLADVGSSISVITSEMLSDLGATNNETVLAFALNTEVGGPRGNFTGGVPQSSGTYSEYQLFTNPSTNTRVRGLSSADNTRNFFRTDVPWDSYTVSRVDLQRGPNAILFGLGKPSGVVNATTNDAMFNTKGRIEFAFDKYNSQRYVLDYNRELLKDELALRVSLLRNDQKFQQDPAYSLDQRVYGAFKYKPGFLNRNDMRFEVSGNFEHGSIDSNRPRIVAPIDKLSQFWAPVNQGGSAGQVFNPYQQPLPTNSESANFIPGIQQKFSATQLNYLANSNRPQTWIKDAVDAYGALDPDGNVIANLNGGNTGDTPNGPFPSYKGYGPFVFKTLDAFATTPSVSLPFSSFGGYRAQTITDPSVYDFYHKLLDGPNKGEWTDWNVGEAHLSNTFLHDTIGYDLSYFKQRLQRGQWSALSYDNAISMDINDTLADGTPNPDVGRAYVDVESRIDGNQRADIDRDAWRVQAFGEYDFGSKHQGLWARILGLHRITGVLSNEDEQSDVRERRFFALDPASMAKMTPEPWIFGGSGDNGVPTTFRYYVSDDLRGQSSAAGSSVSNMGMPFFANIGGPISLYRFDNTWTADASVSPGAAWVNPADPTGTYTQSNNPANYRGWTNTPLNVVTLNSKDKFGDMSAEDYLTYSGNLRDFSVDSRVLVWQGFFWDHAIVGTYGYRRDSARNYNYITGSSYGNGREGTGSQGAADLRPGTYNYDNPEGRVDELKTTTRNWSVAAHINKLLGKHDILPINVSVYYNQGENFEPLAGRLDAFSKPLPPPQGNTKEWSVLLATKDNKYSLRATKFETNIMNATSTGRLNNMWAFEQSLYFTAKRAREVRDGTANLSAYTGNGGNVDYLKNTAVPAWFNLEKEIKQTFPDFVAGWFPADTSWATDSNNDVRGRSAPGFAYTEDSKSKGYEFELIANPTSSWRIAVNASKTQASRDNVPGAAFKQIVDFFDNAVMTTDAGLVPTWGFGDVAGVRGSGPYALFFRPEYLTLSALNGQSQSEVRQWHVNAITNYTFTHGALKGFGAGGAYRWEDKGIIDYAPQILEDGSYTANLNAPFYAPSDTTVDLWISYERKVATNVNWRIQFNVYNVFGKNELIPLRASVDYEKLGNTQITPGMDVPMRASAFSIKEGITWQLTNSFEF